MPGDGWILLLALVGFLTLWLFVLPQMGLGRGQRGCRVTPRRRSGPWGREDVGDRTEGQRP